MEDVVDWILVLATGAVACDGFTSRHGDGERGTVGTLFGCLALLFWLPAPSSTSWS